ncbi:hypothetical protein DA717_12400 [Piscirickettsiaceae bacterium NZ-RLO2]|nr:hypothetical protein DA717_12400 [Piscirickettsiaceae bacterium NZ-RLO2]
MREKGIAANVATKLLENGDNHDRDVAMCLAQKKWPNIKAKDNRQRVAKLAGFLGRKGFKPDLCWEIASLQEDSHSVDS